MPRTVIATLCALFFLSVSVLQAAEQTEEKKAEEAITIATVDYPPLMGLEGGIMTDVVAAAFASREIDVSYRILPMSQIARSILEGNETPVIGSINWFHVDKKKTQLHSVKIYTGSLHFFYLKRRFPEGLQYQSLNELGNHSIGYIRGGSLIPLFSRAKLRPELVSDLQQNVKKVYAQRIDMFAAIELSGWEVIDRKFSDYSSEFEMEDRPIYEIEGDIIFPESLVDLKAEFEQGLAEIRASGEYVNIFRRYYGDRALPAEVMQYAK